MCMEDALIEDDGLSLSRKSRLPGEGFFYPDSLEDERAETRAREKIDEAEAVVVTDSDADGLGCVALIREAYGVRPDPASIEARLEARLAGDDDTENDTRDGNEDGSPDDRIAPDSSVALVPSGPRRFPKTLDRVADYLDPGTDVYICDISPDSYDTVADSLKTIVDRAATVQWFDHHQWDDGLVNSVRELGVDLVVGDSEEECSTDVALRSLEEPFPPRFRELAAVTRDHDLWLKEDPRSEDLADYANWSDPEEYVAIVGTYGVEFPSVVREFLEDRREEKTQLINRAIERAEMHKVGDWTVGVTYGRCSQNEVAEALRQQGADAAVVVNPAGSASIRGSDSFTLAHEVAGQVNGGGHPKAAGCKPDIYDDMLDYAHHWATEGQAAKRVILAAFKRLDAGKTPGSSEPGR